MDNQDLENQWRTPLLASNTLPAGSFHSRLVFLWEQAPPSSLLWVGAEGVSGGGSLDTGMKAHNLDVQQAAHPLATVKADPEPWLGGCNSEAWLSSHRLCKLFLEASRAWRFAL